MALDNFSWVIPKKLAGSNMPGLPSLTSDSIKMDLLEMKDRGIEVIISLEKPCLDFDKLCDEIHLEWLYFPIDDFGVPADMSAFKRLVSQIFDLLESGKAICVHCRAGVGRTGLVLSSVVGNYFSLKARLAIDTVKKTRQSIETSEQINFVYEYLSYEN